MRGCANQRGPSLVSMEGRWVQFMVFRIGVSVCIASHRRTVEMLCFPFPQKQPVLCSPFCFLQSQIERAKVQAFVVRADVLRPLVRRLIARRKLYRMAAAWMVRSGDVRNGWECWCGVVRKVGWEDGWYAVCLWVDMDSCGVVTVGCGRLRSGSFSRARHRTPLLARVIWNTPSFPVPPG